jgi:hypothetical protein
MCKDPAGDELWQPCPKRLLSERDEDTKAIRCAAGWTRLANISILFGTGPLNLLCGASNMKFIAQNEG